MNEDAKPPGYRFRPFARSDLAMAARWLQAPEVMRWWGKPEQELALLTEDIDEPLMRQWIVEHQTRPFAYVQAYEARAWPQPHLQHLPHGSQMVDAFIGEPDLLGHGHGSAFLRIFADKLIAEGAPLVAIDPSIDNLRARRAYARAGFTEQSQVETAEGPVMLMVFRLPAPPATPTMRG